MSDQDEQLRALSTALADRYRIERSLGQGGMATVYLARDLRHERSVALKVLKPELAQALSAQRFLKELHVTANLQHPHILPLYDSGSVGGALFYVMPLMTGESLRDRLAREGTLSVADAVRITQQVAGALDFAHRQGVLHRDIKPENILLQDGEALLADFGIALAVTSVPEARRTGTGISVGTVEYMSPEQAAGERNLDARSDIYSLGAVAYEMLVGKSPVSAASAQAMLAKLMTETPVPPHAARAEVPVSVSNAVQHALEKNPAQRFSSASEFSEAVAGAHSDTTGRSGRARMPFARALVALIAIVATAIGSYVVWPTLSVSAAHAAPIRSIAVLPLALRSADSTQEYFAEGMTDELTAAVATISAIRVTSRGSAMQFQGKARPATSVIAKSLNVDAIVEGSVAREGGQVRITANLIDARVDSTIWTTTLTRNFTDVLALQTALASAIASQIKVQLTAHEKARFASAPTVNSEAHDAYLLGRYFFNRPSDENLQKAIKQFEKSVKLDTTFAAGFSGLSDAYLWAGYNEGFLTAAEAKIKSKQAALRAVRLDSMSAEAHASLATFQKASTMYAPPFVTAYLAFAQGMAGHRDAALKQPAALEKMSPGGKVLPFNLALVYLGLGDRARAIDYLEKAYGADSQLLAWLGQDAMFDSLRSEPRFTALLRKLNFVR